jgi:hypothetical protein
VGELRRRTISILLGVLLLLTLVPVAEAASGVPPLPVALGRAFLSNLSVPSADPGQTVGVGFELSDPLPETIANVTLSFSLYAFNPYPGTGTTALPTSAPVLVAGSASGPEVNVIVGSLAGRSTGWSAPVELAVPGGAPAGTYSIRDALSFDLNGSHYRLASVGNFPPAEWARANVLANGSPTVNLTALGVSGILPETALLVHDTSPLAFALYAILGVGIVLAMAGAYVALRRRGPTSRSGATAPPEESHAPTALGNNRSSDGD